MSWIIPSGIVVFCSTPTSTDGREERGRAIQSAVMLCTSHAKASWSHSKRSRPRVKITDVRHIQPNLKAWSKDVEIGARYWVGMKRFL